MAHDFYQLADRLDADAHYRIADRLEDKYGENPCKQLVLENEETGERLELICNRKHCQDCGPRKAYLNELQIIEAFGDIGWVGRMDRAEVDRAIEAAKKRKQRKGEEFTYMVVGSTRHYYILVSDVPLSPEQRRMDLRDWYERIRHQYTYGTRRRCSRSVSSMSLVRKKKRTTNKGHHQPTWRRVVESAGHSWLAVKEVIHQQHVREREERELIWDRTMQFTDRVAPLQQISHEHRESQQQTLSLV